MNETVEKTTHTHEQKKRTANRASHVISGTWKQQILSKAKRYAYLRHVFTDGE